MSAPDLQRLLAYELLNEALCNGGAPLSLEQVVEARATAALRAVAEWLRIEARKYHERAEDRGFHWNERERFRGASVALRHIADAATTEAMLIPLAAASPAGAAPVSAPTSAPDGGGAVFPSAPPP